MKDASSRYALKIILGCLFVAPLLLSSLSTLPTHSFITTTTRDIYGLGRYSSPFLNSLVCLYQSTTQEKRPTQLTPTHSSNRCAFDLATCDMPQPVIKAPKKNLKNTCHLFDGWNLQSGTSTLCPFLLSHLPCWLVLLTHSVSCFRPCARALKPSPLAPFWWFVSYSGLPRWTLLYSTSYTSLLVLSLI